MNRASELSRHQESSFETLHSGEFGSTNATTPGTHPVVRHADDRGLGNQGRLGEHILDFLGVDVFTPGDHHVVNASHNMEFPLVVKKAEVAGEVPAIAN